jgi:hypothetical protein
LDALKKEKEELSAIYMPAILGSNDEKSPLSMELLAIEQRLKYLNDTIDKVENDAEIVRYRGSSDEDIVKEQIRREHMARRVSLVRQTSPLTDDQKGELDKYRKELIEKEAEKIAMSVVKEGFGNNIFKTFNYGTAKSDVKKGGNNSDQKRIRKLESYGLEVDEKTGRLISFKTPEIAKKWGVDDLEERLLEVGSYGEE